MASDDVIIRIRTAFEKGGIAAAEAELLRLASAGAKASAGTEAFSSKLGSLGQGLRGSALNASQLTQKLSEVAPQIQKASTALQDFKAGILAGIGQGIAGFFAVQAVIRFTGAVKDAAVQYEKTLRTLQFATGSAQEAGKAYGFARGEAERLGVGIASTAEAYSRFAAAAKGTAVSAQDVQTVFTGVLSASRALGLATVDVDRIFRAFTQIIAKGKVTAEEFRGQIGDALPVATAAAAQALGVTTSEFSRLLDAGELTLDFLPKLGAELQRQFGGIAAESTGTLSASISKLENAFNALQLSLANNGGTSIAISGLNALTEAANQVKIGVEGASLVYKGFVDVISGSAFGAFDRSGGLFEGLLEKLGILKASAEETSKAFADVVAGSTSTQARGGLAPGGGSTRNLPGSRPFLPLESVRPNLQAETRNQAKAAQDQAKAVQDAERETARVAKQAASERARASKEAAAEATRASNEVEAAAQKQREAVDKVSSSLREQIESTQAQREALLLGGAEGARYATIQREVAKAIKETGSATADQIAQARRLADEEQGIRDLQFAQSIQEQTAAIEQQSVAFDDGSVEAKRYAVVLREIAAATAAGVDQNAEFFRSVQRLADAESGLEARKEGRRQTEQAAQEVARDFERQSEAITQTLTDAIFRGFENGKSFAENFKDTVKNLFKTLILRPVIEFIVKPIAQFAQQAIGGLLNAGASALFGGGGGGGGGSILGSLFNTGGSTLLQQGASSLFGGAAGAGQFANVVGGASSTAPGGNLLSQTLEQGIGTIIGQNGVIQAGVNQLGFQAGLTGGPSGQAGLLGSQSASSLLSTIGGAVAIAGLSFGIGSLIGRQTGSALQGAAAGGAGGAAGGALLGTYVSPGIGTLIGAVIGLLAGGAGGGLAYQTPPRGFAKFNATGTEALGGKKGLDANKSIVPLGQEIQKSIAAIDKDLGLKLIQDRIKFWIGFKVGTGFRTTVSGKDVNFEDPKRLQAEIFRQEIKDATDPSKTRTEFQKRVLQRGLAKETLPEQLASFDKDLKVRNRLREFTKQVEFDPATEKIKELRKNLRDLTNSFSSLKKEAQELGLGTKRAEDAFKKTKRRTLDEILGIKLDRASEGISAQQQAFQLAGKELPPELQAAGVTLQFKALGIKFRELGIDTKVLDRLLGEALQNLKENVGVASEQERVTAKVNAFQAAGRAIPIELQQFQIRKQFEEISKQFGSAAGVEATNKAVVQTAAAAAAARVAEIASRVPGKGHTAATIADATTARQAAEAAYSKALAEADAARIAAAADAALLAQLLAEALQNLESVRAQARISVQQQAYQLAGQDVPIELQRAGVQLQFAELGKQFQELGLDTGILTELLVKALANLEAAAQAASKLGPQLAAEAQSFQLAGRRVPLSVQSRQLVVQFEELRKSFVDLGLSTANLPILLAEAQAGLTSQLLSDQLSAEARSFQLAGRDIPLSVQKRQIQQEFKDLGKLFNDLGLSTGNLGILLAEALKKVDEESARARRDARQGALERAYQLAGEEIPKAIQIAGVSADFADLSILFRDLGLDSSNLGGLLQKAIDKINKAGEDLKSGGFIGFIDSIGRITELDPRMRDISANDAQFNNVSGFATGTSNRIVTRPELFLAGERGPESVNVKPLSGGGAGIQGDVNINLNGPAIFDDISQAKFTRAVARGLQSRQVRFG